jgi:mRNA-degrading endonuclease RelE of RelBE toxin-antitoxin system
MQVRIDKRFWKQYEKLDTPTKELVLEQLEKCQQAVTFQDIQGLKCSKGRKNLIIVFD